MSRGRNIASDHGLTARMFLTGFLFVALYGVFASVIWLVLRGRGVGLLPIALIGIGIIVAQYWFSDKFALWGMRGRIVTPEEAPELHGAIDRLCALADMKKPRVAIADSDVPNAFATGRNPGAAVVCATTGLMRRLDEPEIEAVLAHELSHVAHRDVAVMTIASSLGVIAGLLTRMMFYAGLFGGGGRGRGTNQQGGTLAIIELIIMLVSIAVYAISFMLTRALSRYRELAADRSGALLIGRPSVLAAALVKITGEMGKIPTRDLRHAEPFNAFFFTPAIAGRGGGTSNFSLSNLFSTHPTLEVRLDQLSKLEAQMGHTS